MGKDIHIRVAKYDTNTNLYKEIELFRKATNDEIDYQEDINGFKKVYIDVGRHSEMFEGMKDGDENDGYGHFPWTSINYASLEPSFAESIKEKVGIDGYYDFYEINLSDFKLYLKNHPTVTDYDTDWGEDWKYGDPTPKKENPLKYMLEQIESYISVADWEYGWNPSSHYKVIFYFDC